MAGWIKLYVCHVGGQYADEMVKGKSDMGKGMPFFRPSAKKTVGKLENQPTQNESRGTGF